MPADVSFPHVGAPAAVERSSHRLPVGVGLAIGACASVGLWVGVIAGLKALFF
jgi:hypothetical protein